MLYKVRFLRPLRCSHILRFNCEIAKAAIVRGGVRFTQGSFFFKKKLYLFICLLFPSRLLTAFFPLLMQSVMRLPFIPEIFRLRLFMRCSRLFLRSSFFEERSKELLRLANIQISLFI